MCVHARVFVNAYESGMNYIHACNKKFFEGILLVENEPACGESWLWACETYICFPDDDVCMLYHVTLESLWSIAVT